MRVPFMLVFRQSKCIGDIKRILLLLSPRMHPRVLSYTFLFLFTAMRI